MRHQGFQLPQLPASAEQELQAMVNPAKEHILTMTTLAGSGHPGGSMSSLEMYLLLYYFARLDPKNPHWENRDRVIVSHGHTSPGVYSALGAMNFFDVEDAVAFFRLAGSPFEGHVDRRVPGIEWDTGNLGQGLSAACAFALSAKLRKQNTQVYCIMGDGEQQKGQISEARRFAVKYQLNQLTALLDYNQLQISGDIQKVMPQQIRSNYESDGWKVLEVNGHSFSELYEALVAAQTIDQPVMILAHTVMGNGVSFMENQEKYHGSPLSEELYEKALQELNCTENPLFRMKEKRATAKFPSWKIQNAPINQLNKISCKTWAADEKTDCRSAFGTTLKMMTEANLDHNPFIVLDCDLAGSVKTSDFAKIAPDHFIECGIQEHHTATLAGALSVDGWIPIFADFGMFGVAETYNQQRLNDINHSQMKLICTHNGLDVGEDGKTHQCIDYVGLLRNIFGFKIVVPADPNQTAKAVQWAMEEPGNVFIGMGRSKLPTLTNQADQVAYDSNYQFEYGTSETLRDGNEVSILAVGPMVYRALEVEKILKEQGISVHVESIACPTLLSDQLIEKLRNQKIVVTYEDHHVFSGLAATLAYALQNVSHQCCVDNFGVSRYGVSGQSDEVIKEMGLDPQTVSQRIIELLHKN